MPIPRIFFTYWEGDRLSQLHYFTILSFLHHHPDDDVIIYTATTPSSTLVQWSSGEHSAPLSKRIKLTQLVAINPDRVKLVPIDFSAHGLEDASPVFRADFTRIFKLHEHGGVWLDMDLIFIQKIPDRLLECDKDILFSYFNTIATGFIASPVRSFFSSKLYEAATLIISEKKLDNYQCLGPILWKKFYLRFFTDVIIAPSFLVYPYDCYTYNQFFLNSNKYVHDETFAIHWYNGGAHATHYINNLNLKALDPSKCVANRLLHELMTVTKKSPSDEE